MTMRLTVGDVAARLRDEGLAGSKEMMALHMTLARPDDDDMPWYVRAAVGAAAWAATAFLLAFLFGVKILESDVTRIVSGVLLVAAALATRRAASAEFMKQAAVAMSLAGQGLIIVGIAKIADSGALAGGAGAVIAAVMILLLPDRVHRFLCALLAAGCAFVAVRDLGWRHGAEAVAIALILTTAGLWRVGARTRSARVAELLEPVGYGLLVALFAVLLFGAAMSGSFSPVHASASRIGIATTLVIAALLIALVVAIGREHGRGPGGPTSLTILVTIVLLAALTRSSPGILAGVTVLVLGFDRRSPVLVGMAAVFLTVFGSVYYYSLSLTLIEKAGVLAASGALLLAARAMLGRGEPRSPDHARTVA